MSKVSDIILRVRDALADPTGDRWSDATLIRLVDEAQKDICKRAKLLRTSTEIDIISLQAAVYLPTDCLLLDRVLYKGELVPLTSHLEMDRISKDWEGDIGVGVEKIIYDKQGRGVIKVYPIQDTVIADKYTLTSDYGIVTDIEGLTMNSELGVVTTLTQGGITENFDSVYGVITDITESAESITVYYLKKPTTLTLLTDNLSIDETYDKAMKHYVVGYALRNDMDTQNRSAGNEELMLYGDELKIAISDDSTDFVRNNTQYEVSYKGGFE